MSFEFVAYDGPNLPADPNVRRLIRQQAMREIGLERRQRGNYGQHNRRQYPIFLQRPGHRESAETAEVSSDACHRHSTVLHGRPVELYRGQGQIHTTEEDSINTEAVELSVAVIPRSPPSGISNTENLSILLDLAPLTGLRLGVAQLGHDLETAGPSNLLFKPALGSRKLFSFIPSRYGQVPSLSHATDCVAAKILQITRSINGQLPIGDTVVLLHYTKALRALQTALDDDTQRTTAETLCATELLGIFELLNGNTGASWMSHAGGAAQIIKARGPHRFETEFELSLFAAHLGPTVMDAFLNNKPCFLTRGPWKEVLYSAVASDEAFHRYKELATDLWGHLIDGPRHFKLVTELIKLEDQPAQSFIDECVQIILGHYRSLLRWGKAAYEHSHSVCMQFEGQAHEATFTWPTLQSSNHQCNRTPQLALWGTYVLCRILKARLLVAVAPKRFHHLEKECQAFASKIMTLSQGSEDDDGQWVHAQLLISQSIWVAKGILETASIWSESGQSTDGMIEKWKFEAWCRAIGRRT